MPHPIEKKIDDHSAVKSIYRDEAEFFVDNPRGVLIHRVKHVCDHYHHDEYHHSSVDFFCGNSTCFHKDSSILVDEFGDHRILCLRCEVSAVLEDCADAEDLLDRHVHVGGIRAVRFCCKPEN